MPAVAELLEQVRGLGVELRVRDDSLEAHPPGKLPEDLRASIREYRADVIAALQAPPPSLLDAAVEDEHAALTPLEEDAASLGAVVRFNLRETDDADADLILLHRIHALINEWPGINRIIFRVRTLAGDTHRLEWHALASRSLRRGIARLLARRALGDRALEGCSDCGADTGSALRCPDCATERVVTGTRTGKESTHG